MKLRYRTDRLILGAVLVAFVVPGVAFAGALQARAEARILLLAVAVGVTLALLIGFGWRFFLTRVEISDSILSVASPLKKQRWRIPDDVIGIEDRGGFYNVTLRNAAGSFCFRSGLFHGDESIKPFDDLVSKARAQSASPHAQGPEKKISNAPHPMEDARHEMNEQLQAIVVPHLRALGFRGSLPHFRRISDTGVELLTFQFRLGGGSFVVEAGHKAPYVVSPDWENRVPPEKLTAHHLSRRKRIGGNVLGLQDPWFDFRSRACHEVAAQVVAALPEADEYWREAKAKKPATKRDGETTGENNL